MCRRITTFGELRKEEFPYYNEELFAQVRWGFDENMMDYCERKFRILTREEADEVIYGVFDEILAIIIKGEIHKPDTPIKGVLFQYLWRRCCDLARKLRKPTKISLLLVRLDEEFFDENPRRKKFRKVLIFCFDNLPLRQRQIVEVYRREYGRLKQKEIAEQLGITGQRVSRVIRNQAPSNLRKCLEGKGFTEEIQRLETEGDSLTVGESDNAQI